MDEPQTSIRRTLTRRHACVGFGASTLGLALANRVLPVLAQDDEAELLQSETDVVYSTVGGVPLLLDVVRPADRPEPRPAVVVIHGGGLVQGTRWDHGEAATNLALAGYVTFSIEYRLFVSGDPTTFWPAQLDDVQRAVRWVRANADMYGVDSNRVGAFGFSSGGQLAAFLGTRETRDESDPELAGYSSKATCVVTMGGLFDFTFANAHPDSLETDAEILGGSAEALPPPTAYEDFSPVHFVDNASAPFLILQEGNEDVIPYEQPQRMVAALQAAGVQVSYSWFPDYAHDSWFDWAAEAPETLAFFGRHLTPEV
ncbi:MAG: alpha/beta hydrolase [Thermomicrobiales bacterium]|nr:alpha/beta hydrolase [Thermomicrobiales bacterium]